MATQRTVLDLIKQSLSIIQVRDPSESLPYEDTADALSVLQDLLAEHAGGLSVPIVVQESLTLVSAQNSYTIGENGTPDLDTQRPEQITGAWVRSGNFDYPVQIISERGYRKISYKTSGGRPVVLWYNATIPNGTIYVYPTPVSADSLYLSSIKSLPEPTKLTENLLNDVGLARNYHSPFKWLLAVELAMNYGQSPSQFMIIKAERRS